MGTRFRTMWFTIFLFVALIAQALYFAVVGAWSEVFVVTVAIIFSLIPYALTRYYKLESSEWVRTGIVFFTFCTLVLGEVYKFYSIFWWWDIFLHAIAGAGLAVVMYIWLCNLINLKSIVNTPWLYSLFVFCGANTVLVLWEVYEFFIDQLEWSSNRMQPSLYDTMVDITIGLLSVLLVCLGGFVFLFRQRIKANNMV